MTLKCLRCQTTEGEAKLRFKGGSVHNLTYPFTHTSGSVLTYPFTHTPWSVHNLKYPFTQNNLNISPKSSKINELLIQVSSNNTSHWHSSMAKQCLEFPPYQRLNCLHLSLPSILITGWQRHLFPGIVSYCLKGHWSCVSELQWVRSRHLNTHLLQLSRLSGLQLYWPPISRLHLSRYQLSWPNLSRSQLSWPQHQDLSYLDLNYLGLNYFDLNYLDSGPKSAKSQKKKVKTGVIHSPDMSMDGQCVQK